MYFSSLPEIWFYQPDKQEINGQHRKYQQYRPSFFQSVLGKGKYQHYAQQRNKKGHGHRPETCLTLLPRVITLTAAKH